MNGDLKNSKMTNKIVMSGLMIALVFVATFLPKIPIPGGYVNLGDGMVIFAGFLFGPLTGLISGAVGSALSDAAGGYYMWIPVTFVVKGIEGLVAGHLVRKSRDALIPVTSLLTIAIMPIGYFVGEWLLLSIIDHTLGWVSAVSNLFFNGLQAAACYVLALVLIFGLKRFKM